MRAATSKPSSPESGMTLLEMMVSVSILVLIIVGLTAAFNQTQRIFVAGLSQTDTLEGGRSALDLIRRDLEPAAGWQYISNNTPVAVVGIEQGPVPMSLVTGGFVTNVLEKLFLLRQSLGGAVYPGTNFIGVGYRVLNTYTNVISSGSSELNLPPPFVGTLYRFSSGNVLTPAPVGALLPANLPSFVLSGLPAYSPANLVAEGYLTPVVDGVIHFQVNLYDRNGTLMTNYFPQNIPTAATPANIANETVNENYPVYASAPPAFIEIELGVMDPAVLDQFKALFPSGGDGLPNPESLGGGLVLPILVIGSGGGSVSLSVPQRMAGFLSSHSANIHYFRTQVPLRTSLTTPLP